MPRVMTTTVYQFSELDDRAKEKAREWWRECEAQDFDTGCLYDDFKRIAEILGVTFDTRAFKTMGGKTGYELRIWWALHRQGAGASFDGRYQYARRCVRKLKAYAPKDEVLHGIAQDLAAVQAKHRYGLSAKVTSNGREVHELATTIEVYTGSGDYADEATTEAITEALRRFMRWMYKTIDAEWDYRMSDESVDEAIEANEYEFTETGERCVKV